MLDEFRRAALEIRRGAAISAVIVERMTYCGGVLGAVLLLLTACGPSDRTPPVDSNPCRESDAALAEQSADVLFGAEDIPDFELYLPAADWTELKVHARDEEYTTATACFRGRLVGEVGLRFKGSLGTLSQCFDPSGIQVCPKLSLKVKFDEVDPTLRFFRQKRLNFHALTNDPSKLHDRLSYDLYREMGVIAPRASWAVISVNGESQGLYGMVEEIDGRFAADRWPGAGDGELFKESWPNSPEPAFYSEHLTTHSDTSGADELATLASELATAGDRGRETLARYMDLDYLARYLAVDDAINNWDGATMFYWDEAQPFGSKNHNFYLYREQERAFYWLLPWDLDNTFGLLPLTTVSGQHWTRSPGVCATQRSGVTDSGRPAACDPLFRAAAAELREYRSQVEELLAGPLAAALDQRIAEFSARIDAAVRADPLGPTYEAWQASIQELKGDLPVLRERLAWLAGTAPITALTLDPSGRNGFEQVEANDVVLGAGVAVSRGSWARSSLNHESALEGASDLRVEFHFRNSFLPAWQWLYFPIPLGDGNVDLRERHGLRLRVRADRERNLRLSLESFEQTHGDAGARFGWDVAVGDEPRDVQLAFEDLSLPAGAKLDYHANDVLAHTSTLSLTAVPQTSNLLGSIPTGEERGRIQIDAVEVY
jgi:spore coat protein H